MSSAIARGWRLLAGALVLAAACSGQVLLGGGGVRDGGAPSDGGALDLAVGVPCGESMCAVGEVCELGACHLDCGKSARCGTAPMETCCATGEVCYLGACTMPGAPCGNLTGGDAGLCITSSCPSGQYCEGSIRHCLPLAPTGSCEYHPPVGQFSPTVKWEWKGSAVLPAYDQVMMAPMVADVDGDCMPDVVFATFNGSAYDKDGVLRAVRGDGSRELWTVTDASLRVVPGSQVAIGDVDADGRAEIFACHESRALVAFQSDGTRRWMSAGTPCASYDAPSLANVDHAGGPEVIVGFLAFDAQTGALLTRGKPPTVAGFGAFTVAVELDGDDTNGMEIVAGNAAYHYDGSVYWDHSGGSYSYPAIGDLDGDGAPDVVGVNPSAHTVTAYKHDGAVLWGPVDVNNGVPTPEGPSGGGPPTIADFDGDGRPDVAAAGGYGYLVLVGRTGKPMWQSTMTTDTSSRVTGSSVFDFEGDGVAEAIYNDEHNLRVYSGPTGKVLVKLCSTSGTLWEYPVIVDVDGDDHAEIVVMDNNYAFPTCDQDVGGAPSHAGFKVIGDAKNRWVRTRRLWNQHAYHVTNVRDDGRIPISEAPNWKQAGLDNFRQNVQTSNVTAAPDLVPRDLRGLTDQCASGILGLVVTVVNQGEAVAPAGVPVGFYQSVGGKLSPLGRVSTKGPILAGGAETVTLPWTLPMVDGGDGNGPFQIVAVVDDDGQGGTGVVNECREDNNASVPTSLGCPHIG